MSLDMVKPLPPSLVTFRSQRNYHQAKTAPKCPLAISTNMSSLYSFIKIKPLMSKYMLFKKLLRVEIPGAEGPALYT